MSRPRRKQRGSSACAFTQALGGEILRQAREMDQLRPDAIFGVYILGSLNRPQPHQSRRTAVRIFRERRTGGDPCYVVETPPAQTRFATTRQAVEAFTFSVEFAIRKICTSEERGEARRQIGAHVRPIVGGPARSSLPPGFPTLPRTSAAVLQHVDAPRRRRFVQRRPRCSKPPSR